MRYLTFALGKGRLAKQTLEIFEKIGVTCEEMKNKDSRKLIFVNEDLKLRFFLSKGPDVPTYVEYGAADIGIVGKDTILEEGGRFMKYWIWDTAPAGCVCAGPKALLPFFCIMNGSGSLPNIPILRRITFIIPSTRLWRSLS